MRQTVSKLLTTLLILLTPSTSLLGLEINKERLIEITTVVEAPQILYDANRLLEWSIDSTEDIFIMINSPGGSVYAGLQFISAMRIAQKRGVTIRCIVPGMAMSMAFQFYLECDERYVLPYALLLWHPVRIYGSFVLTPVVAQDLANSLLQAEEDLLPKILDTLRGAGMGREDILYHYDMETVWTGLSLRSVTSDFHTVVDDVEGMKSVWHVNRMMGGHLGSPLAPRDGTRWDIQYIAPEELWLRDRKRPEKDSDDEEKKPKKPAEPKDCRSCHSPKPGHGGTIR